MLIVSCATVWMDIDVIFNTFDMVRDRIKQNRNQDIFICHKGGKHRAEMIAARWPRARGVAQGRFDLRWSAQHRSSATTSLRRPGLFSSAATGSC